MEWHETRGSFPSFPAGGSHTVMLFVNSLHVSRWSYEYGVCLCVCMCVIVRARGDVRVSEW